MRKILFRGKDLIHNEWIYGGIAEDNHDSIVILPQKNWSNGGCVDKSTVGQFTGMYDKHEREIYEGDIVDAPYIDSNFREKHPTLRVKAVIKFRNGAFVVEYSSDCRIYLQDLHDKIEVIGNIYDNPELIICG